MLYPESKGGTPSRSNVLTSRRISRTSASTPGLSGVANMIADLSSPVGRAHSRPITKNRVTLLGLSSMFAQMVFRLYRSAAR